MTSSAALDKLSASRSNEASCVRRLKFAGPRSWAGRSIQACGRRPRPMSWRPLPRTPTRLRSSRERASIWQISTHRGPHPEARSPIATGIATRDADKRPTPLGWRNAVTEPVVFADIDSANSAKVLAGIREHVPADAVALSWWDMSRRIRSVAGRQAPLDDPLARGLLTPTAWSANAAAIDEKQRAFSGRGRSQPGRRSLRPIHRCAAPGRGARRGVLPNSPTASRPLSPCICLTSGRRRQRGPISAYRDFPGGGEMHGVMKAAREWMQENKIEGGFAVEPGAPPSASTICRAKRTPSGCWRGSCRSRAPIRSPLSVLNSSISTKAIGFTN